MRAHCFQHIPFEGLGSIGPWLEQAGYRVTSTCFYESAEMPDPDAIDALVVMGGSMSVNDEAAFPWLVAEKRYIRECIRAEKPVLGICLGAQLIASAMGAPVYPNPVPEIGWFVIRGLPTNDVSSFGFPPSAPVFHWHNDTFDLPSGAIHLAVSDACEHQAFQLGKSVIGLQFHLEVTAESLAEMIAQDGDELVPSATVQDGATILAADPARYAGVTQLMYRVLTYLF
ncbi:type 1 glutamine amidotransferase [Marinobacter caseinilyticus]|uniref:type 1 glutamine amidotransferase n=1 Tax=Marinobacter caseinilyticus TaxID=2692195 RepID=UPI00140A3BEB|nr:gamma-glutamyl-gamma-aminobutyrate hydrolase family protein [Marinobacter caseinilyticus]